MTKNWGGGDDVERGLQIVGLLAAFFAGSWAVNMQAAGPTAEADLRQRAEARGYRVREVRWDPVLQQRWAVLESVAHPERPPVAELTDAAVSAPSVPATVAGSAAVFKTQQLAVRSGETVVLWSAEQNVRMQMAAVAEGNAAVGDRIQLRVTGAGVNGDAGWRVAGVVRGAGSVEMER